MPDPREIDLAVQQLMRPAAPQEWHKEMIAYYQRTGTFRTEDLRRVLGDPTKGVTIISEKSLESFLST